MVYSKRVWQNFSDLRRAMNERGVDVLFFGGGVGSVDGLVGRLVLGCLVG
jgi:acetate kinase